jgi:hypothetical protein
MSEAGPVEEAQAEQKHAIVPIDGLLRSEQPKTPFWRRLSLRAIRRVDGSLAEPTDDDRILGRLDAIAAQLAASEHSLSQRIDQLDEKFTDVWEVEETLSRLIELHELLTEMRERQGGVDGRLRGLERRLSWIALLAATAAIAAIVATVVALTA